MLELDLQLARPHFALDVRAGLSGPATGIFGPSGAGKTTLLHGIAGLLRPDAGRICLDGEVLFDSRRRIDVPPHRRRIGLVFQDSRLFPHLSVRGNLEYGLKHAPGAAGRSRFESIVELLGIEPLLDKPVGGLSGGERQRVALGRALLGAPRLLLLDEPLAALDHAARRVLLPILARLRAATGIPLLHVSHDLGEILELSAELLVLEGGRVRCAGAYDQLIREPESLESLLGLGLVNSLALRVRAHQAEQGMTLLEPAGETGGSAETPRPLLHGPLWPDCPPGSEVRVVLRPQDVTLSTAPCRFVSMQNQLPGHVIRIVRLRQQTLCQIDAGVRLLAEVTHQAIVDLKLEEGQAIWCLFKAHALRLTHAVEIRSPANSRFVL